MIFGSYCVMVFVRDFSFLLLEIPLAFLIKEKIEKSCSEEVQIDFSHETMFSIMHILLVATDQRALLLKGRKNIQICNQFPSNRISRYHQTRHWLHD
jgi:hypothetical protein